MLNSDLQQNWRLGATLAFPVNRENSIKLYASSGVSSRTGNDYDLIGVAWQYRWGGGLWDPGTTLTALRRARVSLGSGVAPCAGRLVSPFASTAV